MGFVPIFKEESRPEFKSLRKVKNRHDVNIAKVFAAYRSEVE